MAAFYQQNDVTIFLLHIPGFQYLNFKTKWLTSGGFFSNYNSSECGRHVLEQNDNFRESDWLKKKHPIV